MRISDLDYDLPDALIAQQPLAKRDASRLLLLDVASDGVEDRLFTELPDLLPPSLFVFNDTRVFPARLLGHKDTGGRVELLLLRRNSEAPDHWLAMGRSSKGLRPGMELSLCDGQLTARVVRALDHGQLEVKLEARGDVDALIEQVGEVPLPPYIRRAAEDADKARYQTVYARKPGAVAAPTAGLHFTENTLSALTRAGHQTAYVTLHVGPGTFRPVQVDALDDHEMHEEAYEVPEDTVAAIGRAREEGRPVVAVGTTVVRSLETAAGVSGLTAGEAESGLFITPGYRLRVVDAVITNFHAPRTTLLVMIAALLGPRWREVYAHAIDGGYRFLSFGDAMFIDEPVNAR